MKLLILIILFLITYLSFPADGEACGSCKKKRRGGINLSTEQMVRMIIAVQDKLDKYKVDQNAKMAECKIDQNKLKSDLLKSQNEINELKQEDDVLKTELNKLKQEDGALKMELNELKQEDNALRVELNELKQTLDIFNSSGGQPGPKGDIGNNGAKGEPGEEGATGMAGEKGFKGDMGEGGQPGSNGSFGPKGAVGAQGAKGLEGPQGPQGLKGPQAPKGEVGPQGTQGHKGDTGENGQKGAQGLKGNPGLKGDPGVAVQKQAFTVYRRGVGSAGVLTYDSFKVQEGTGMDIYTGTYTIPVAGHYVISLWGVAAVTEGEYSTDLDIYLDSDKVAFTWVDAAMDCELDWCDKMLGSTRIIHATVGQQLYVDLPKVDGIVNYIYFSSYLLYED